MWARGQLVIGATARELLMRPGLTGRVLAVVTGAVYLQCVIARSEATKPRTRPNRSLGIASQKTLALTEGEIVWLAQSHLPMHTRAVRGDFDFSALNVGMSFKSDGACLRLEVGDRAGSPLRLADACVWQPSTIDPARVAPRELVMARANELEDLTGSLPRKPVRSLRELVGLGEGLTPAGDDFVGGVLFARWHLHRAYPGITSWDQPTVDALIGEARTQTNVISHAILREHAAGQSVEPMHHLIASLLCGESLDAIMPQVRNLIGIGHSSGQEMLAGLITGISQNIRIDSSP